MALTFLENEDRELRPGQAFGKVLRELRSQRGQSQEVFAFECGLNRQFISLLELGEREPSIETIYKVAVGLGMHGSELLRHVEEKLRAVSKRRSRSAR